MRHRQWKLSARFPIRLREDFTPGMIQNGAIYLHSFVSFMISYYIFFVFPSWEMNFFSFLYFLEKFQLTDAWLRLPSCAKVAQLPLIIACRCGHIRTISMELQSQAEVRAHPLEVLQLSKLLIVTDLNGNFVKVVWSSINFFKTFLLSS